MKIKINETHGPKTMIISADSCNGEEEAFEAWLNEKHPSIITKIDNTLDGGLYDSNGDLVEEENYWDQYCAQ